MIADFFTKPLQGTLFRTFRNFILNVDHAGVPPQDPRSVLKHPKSEIVSQPIKAHEGAHVRFLLPDDDLSDDWITVGPKNNKNSKLLY
jgi:hypothetical protein